MPPVWAATPCAPLLQSFVLVLRSLVPMWPPCPASVPVLKSLVLISASLLVLQSCMLVLRSLIPVASAPYAESIVPAVERYTCGLRALC